MARFGSPSSACGRIRNITIADPEHSTGGAWGDDGGIIMYILSPILVCCCAREFSVCLWHLVKNVGRLACGVDGNVDTFRML